MQFLVMRHDAMWNMNESEDLTQFFVKSLNLSVPYI